MDCSRDVIVQRPAINRPLHLTLTLLTGLWGGIWYEIEQSRPSFRCPHCGLPFGPIGREARFSPTRALVYAIMIATTIAALVALILVVRRRLA